MTNHTKRKIRYIDSALQNRLLTGFILLEILLLGGGMAWLYFDLSALIDTNLYRIHLAASEQLPALLLRETLQVLAVIVLLNVVALAAVEWLWSRHLNTILQPLSNLLARTSELDFTPDDADGQRHAVLSLVLAWRDKERQRSQAVHAEISRLSDQVQPLEQTRAALEKLKALTRAD